ncbi:MAG TPA: hypothetical protein VFA26_01205 [Gemmataceae bacterium]|nr:hypothetical protein [Gemmataceae bacterium]
MQVDKDTLIKHRFWILLGAFGLLWVVGLIALLVGVSGKSAEARGKYDEALKKVKGISNPKNESHTSLLKQKEAKLQRHKLELWKKVWQQQAGFETWPLRDDVQTPSLRQIVAGGSFGDKISDEDCISYRDHLYALQFDGKAFDRLIYPAVYLNGWEKIMAPVKWTHQPTSEECWLAQEDFWVKRDLLFAVRDALVAAAVMKPVPADKGARPAEGELPPQRFRNANWELNVVLEKSGNQLFISPKTTIKNINAHRRTLLPRDVQVAVWAAANPQQARTLYVEGEPVGWGASTQVVHERVRIDHLLNFKPAEPGAAPDYTLGAAQVFTLRTSPIKQVNDIRLGYHSDRTKSQTLVAKQMAGSPKPDEGGDSAQGGTPTGGAGGNVPGGTLMMGGSAPPGGGSLSGPPGGGVTGAVPGGGMMPGAGRGSGDLTPNGLDRKRYIQVTPQVRRMPLAMVLVLDQQYIPDVLAALANSRLRIQTTQVHWKHETRGLLAAGGSHPDGLGMDGPVPDGGMGGLPEGGFRPPGGGSSMIPPPGAGSSMIPPPGAGSSMIPPPGAGSFPGGMIPHPTSGSGGYGRMPYGPGYRPPGIGQGGYLPGSSSAMPDDDDPNLVELSFYGIASLYERYKPPAPAAGEGNTQPKTPPGGSNPPPGTGNQQPPGGDMGKQQPPSGDMGKQPAPGGDMGKDAGKQAPKDGGAPKDAAGKGQPPADDKSRKDGRPK